MFRDGRGRGGQRPFLREERGGRLVINGMQIWLLLER